MDPASLLESQLHHTNCAPALFSNDPRAVSIHEACDYTIRITAEMARLNMNPRPVRVYSEGVYDMFHSGHARQLMQAKLTFPNTYLIVGVHNDADVKTYKGITVMNENERYEQVRHCRYVDEVLIDAPWPMTIDLARDYKIDFIAHDDMPYPCGDTEDIYTSYRKAGMFFPTQRTEGISTTDVIGRIIRGYDAYLRRNIKRGLSRKDLNISFVTEKRLQVEDNLYTIFKRGSSLMENIGTKRQDFVRYLEDVSHDVFHSFMNFFGSDGGLRNWLDTRKPSTLPHEIPLHSHSHSRIMINSEFDDSVNSYDGNSNNIDQLIPALSLHSDKRDSSTRHPGSWSSDGSVSLDDL